MKELKDMLDKMNKEAEQMQGKASVTMEVDNKLYAKFCKLEVFIEEIKTDIELLENE